MAQETQQNGCVERFAQQVDTMGVKSCEPVSEQVLPRTSLDDLLPQLLERQAGWIQPRWQFDPGIP